ncbi:MAG: class I SAM-dependent methyltransferase [Planctomycetota bacterium]
MYEHFEEIYKGGNPDEIPWNNEQPPELLVELVETRLRQGYAGQGGKVRPGRALDLGCGLGNYAIWLAGRGFDVVGMDASPTAIKIAKRNAKEKKVKCKFVVADLTARWPDWGGQFDFVYDWGLLHHIMPENRDKYVENVHRVLKQGGKYLSLCFNEKDTAFSAGRLSAEGRGKYRGTNLGTNVYLSSEKELRELFGRFFKIIDFRVQEIAGKFMTHVFNYCFMERNLWTAP